MKVDIGKVWPLLSRGLAWACSTISKGLTVRRLNWTKGPGLNFFQPGDIPYLELLPTFSWNRPSKPEEQAAVLLLCLWEGTEKWLTSLDST